MKATNGEIREWLNKQIEALRVINETLVLEEHEDSIDDLLKNLSRRENIQLAAEAVRGVADRLDLDLYVSHDTGNTENPYEVAFMWKGIMFFGLESDEEYHTRGPVA